MIKPVHVYLAGGFKSGWQDAVRKACLDLELKHLVVWEDHRENGTSDPDIYGPIDRRRCEKSSIVFGFAEIDNPLPFPLFFEMGFFLGQKKLVIYVNEIQPEDKRYRPYLFPTKFDNKIYTEYSLETGIKKLRFLIQACTQ